MHAPPCSPVDPAESLLLVVPEDPWVSAEARSRLESNLRGGDWTFLSSDASTRALGAERGAARRRRVLEENRLRLQRAAIQFRELEDELALDLVSDVTTELVGIHQEPGAVELLAEAHLLAGAIFLARGRIEAGRTRLQRALDLNPALAPPRDRYAPRVLAELANTRASEGTRPRGELFLRVRPAHDRMRAFIDGRPIEDWPERPFIGLGAGRHLIRVSAPGTLSYLGSVEVRPFESTELELRLAPDPVVARLSELSGRLRSGDDVDELLAALAQRAGANRTVAAWVRVSADAHPDGRDPLGATIVTQGGGRAEARSLDLEEVRGALDRSLACGSTSTTRLAPALIPPASGRVSHEPDPPPRWYERPWIWAAVGVVAVGVTSSIVAARASSGPPDAVDIELIPRP